MTVVVAVPAMTVMMMTVTDVHHDLGVCGLGERCSENKSEQGVPKDFDIYCYSDSFPQVVMGMEHLHQPVILTEPGKRLV